MSGHRTAASEVDSLQDVLVDSSLHRFWIRLETDHRLQGEFGVTAFSEDDALAILGYIVFGGDDAPRAVEIRRDVDVRDLDQGRVIPNIAPPNLRGIWYPAGYDRGPDRIPS